MESERTSAYGVRINILFRLLLFLLVAIKKNMYESRVTTAAVMQLLIYKKSLIWLTFFDVYG